MPFTSDRKMMSTLEADHDHDDAPVVVAKGAPGVVLARCTQLQVGPATLDLDAPMRAHILAEVGALADAALRTLAVAYRPLDPGESPTAHVGLEQRLIYVGTVGIIDPPRAEVGQAIRQAQAAGIRVVMITGDHPRTVLRIAADLGIVRAGSAAQPPPRALTGTELDALAARGEPALAEAVRATRVFARAAQRFNCFNPRSETRSAWHGLFANPWLWATVGLSVVLQVAVVHLEFLNQAFGTAPLSPAQWGVCVAMASGVLWFGEPRKWVLRTYARRPARLGSSRAVGPAR